MLRDPGRTGEAFPCHFPSATSAWITTAARCDVCADRPGQPPEQPFAVANDGAGVAELTARLRRAGAREAALERGDGPLADALVAAGDTSVIWTRPGRRPVSVST